MEKNYTLVRAFEEVVSKMEDCKLTDQALPEVADARLYIETKQKLILHSHLSLPPCCITWDE